jgi:MOSC domain-containing protein YiiM
MRRLLVLSVIICSGLFGENLLTNGAFEQPLSVGWLQATSGSNVTINRATTYDPDPDFATRFNVSLLRGE